MTVPVARGVFVAKRLLTKCAVACALKNANLAQGLQRRSSSNCFLSPLLIFRPPKTQSVQFSSSKSVCLPADAFECSRLLGLSNGPGRASRMPRITHHATDLCRIRATDAHFGGTGRLLILPMYKEDFSEVFWLYPLFRRGACTSGGVTEIDAPQPPFSQTAHKYVLGPLPLLGSEIRSTWLALVTLLNALLEFSSSCSHPGASSVV